jgi:hypothetical protein
MNLQYSSFYKPRILEIFGLRIVDLYFIFIKGGFAVANRKRAGRPPFKRTEPLYFKITPDLKEALYRVQGELTPSVGRVSLTDVVTHLLWYGIEAHDTKKQG